MIIGVRFHRCCWMRCALQSPNKHRRNDEIRNPTEPRAPSHGRIQIAVVNNGEYRQLQPNCDCTQRHRKRHDHRLTMRQKVSTLDLRKCDYSRNEPNRGKQEKSCWQNSVLFWLLNLETTDTTHNNQQSTPHRRPPRSRPRTLTRMK